MIGVVSPQYARSGISVNGVYLCVCACVCACVCVCLRGWAGGQESQGASEAAHAPHVALVAGGRGVQRLCVPVLMVNKNNMNYRAMKLQLIIEVIEIKLYTPSMYWIRITNSSFYIYVLALKIPIAVQSVTKKHVPSRSIIAGIRKITSTKVTYSHTHTNLPTCTQPYLHTHSG